MDSQQSGPELPNFSFSTESNRGDEFTEFGRLRLKNLSFGGEFLNECGSTIICFSFWKLSMIEILRWKVKFGVVEGQSV
ncbi:hypothetical protein L195_g040539, partial [Trifolium pratense]